MAFKLPSAYLCGVRLKDVNGDKATVSVKYKWINQNPFNSMYFAVQSMAAELSTGALVLDQISKSGEKISMLVAAHQGSFTKKAKGRISFTCSDGAIVKSSIEQAIKTREGVLMELKTVGVDQAGDVVSSYSFTWTIKCK